MANDRTLTPRQAIRALCIDCVGERKEVKDCGGDKLISETGAFDAECAFFRFRLGKGRPTVRMIRKYCVTDCMNEQAGLVRDCVSFKCALHPFGMGKNPRHAGRGFTGAKPVTETVDWSDL